MEKIQFEAWHTVHPEHKRSRTLFRARLIEAEMLRYTTIGVQETKSS